MMESPFAAGGPWAPVGPHLTYRTTGRHPDPVPVSQTAWPAFPLPVPYEVSGTGPPLLLATEYAGVVLPPQLRVLPSLCYTVTAERPTHSRKSFLDRSIFDLVNAHPYLSLTDPKLLSWYLSLSPEDRRVIQDEGGFQQYLQRHPALELSRHHVYVKCKCGQLGGAGPAQRAGSSNKHTSGASGVKTCISDPDLYMVPSDQHEELCHSGLLVSLDSFHTAFSSPVTQDPAPPRARRVPLDEDGPSWQMASGSTGAPAGLASFSVDAELDGHRRGPRSGHRSHSANGTNAEGSPVQWRCVTGEREFSEYYSFDRVHMDGTESKDRGCSQPVSPGQASAPLDPVEENGTKEGCEESTVPGNEASLSCADQSDGFHGIMGDGTSTLVCLASKDLKAQDSGLLSGPVSTASEAVAASSEPPQSAITTNTADRIAHASTLLRPTTRDITVGTEPTLRTSAFTQTEQPGASDKHIVTEVHMADLDYLAEEFIRLMMAKEELREQKEKVKSLGCRVTQEREWIQRAQQAELSLLALQYSMCTQHCWRLYRTCAEGGQLSPRPTAPPAIVVGVLQKLESDYSHMRAEILAGVPLEQLKPLSVDTDEITTGARYIPAQLAGDVLGNEPSWAPAAGQPQKHCTSGGEHEGPDDQSPKKGNQTKKDSSRVRRDVSVVAQDRDAVHAAHEQEEKQTTARKELDSSEAWYDAEEDLESDEQLSGKWSGNDQILVTTESGGGEAGSSVLCVSSLPTSVTESDVMRWFERYRASEVRISALSNGLRLAIVMIGGPRYAEAAVRELNGRSVRGHTLHVEHIHGASGGGQSRVSASSRPQTPSTERQVTSRPPFGSGTKNRRAVCISPTAEGTCVPQHYGTMGSFDTLMAELTRLHPEAGRQRIVDALVELRAERRGVLGGLPLGTIRDMASELLSRPPQLPPRI
ncbi:RNA-binding protein 44 [Pempheris klunzingeri]|uniref:RNA-binding protein 44 n=1 Tax=Pempheris klunzingeri TaxID=3127111 RepID=UPI0039802340